MKALLVVREPHENWSFLGHDRTPVMLPFLDRPLLQHAVESLVSQGCTEISIATMTALERIRSLVGQGRRWGAKITVHPLRDLTELPALALAIATNCEMVVGDAERLPKANAFVAAVTGDHREITVEDQGWRKVKPTSFGDIPWIVAVRGAEVFLDVTTPTTYMDSWQRAVKEEQSGFVRTGRETSEDVVVGRGARIHPSAKVVGPVYVGERCLVGPGAEIGPNAFVGADSIIENEGILADCAVFPHTYVGPRLEVRRKLVYRSTMYDLDRKVSLDAVEDFLLGGTRPDRNMSPRLPERLAALLMAIVLLPVSLLGLLADLFTKDKGTPIGYPRPTADLFQRVAPGLWSVAAGRRRLVGIPPLDAATRRELEILAPGLVAQVPEGLISDAYVRFGPRPTVDEMWASVAFSAFAKDKSSQLALVKEYATAAVGLSRLEWAKPRE